MQQPVSRSEMTADYGKQTARFDNDEWDILSSVGYTAFVVARLAGAAREKPEAAGPRRLRTAFITASADPYLTALLASPPTTNDSITFPRRYGVPTRRFDEFFLSAADEAIGTQ